MSQLLDPTHDKFIGVETLLKPGSRIVYETLFSMRHAGRVIDLILHEAREHYAAVADLEGATSRARHTLELMVLNAWSHYRPKEITRCLEIEAGWDDEKIVFSVAGFVADGISGLVPSLGAPGNDASKGLARYFGAIEDNVTMLALRHHKDIGFLQSYAVIALDVAAPKQPAHVVELVKPADYVPAPEYASAGGDWLAAAAPLPKEPLGSSENTEEFLGDERSDEAGRAMATGRREEGADGPVVINAKRALAGEEPLALQAVSETPVEEDFETVVSGGDFGPDSTETLVKGMADEGDDTVTTVSGGGPVDDQSVTRVAGGTADAQDETVMRVGGGPMKTEDKTVTRIKGSNTAPKKKGNLKVVSGSAGAASSEDEASLDELILGAVDDSGANGAPGEGDADDLLRISGSGPAKAQDETVTRIKAGIQKKSEDLKRVISGKKNVSKSDQEILKVLESSSSEEAAEVAAILVEGAKAESESGEPQTNVDDIVKDIETTSAATESAAAAAEETVAKSGKEFETQINMAQKLMDRVEMPEKVKQFFSDAFQKLAKNRGELNEQIKDINGKWRTAQLEFKNKQTALTTEIQKRDVQMRLKDSAIEKSKEVLARTLKSMEDYKVKAEQSGNAESAHKIAQANAVAAKAKDHAQKLQAKLDEVQKKLSQESNTRANAQTEKAKLEQQNEQQARKIAELEKNKGVVKEDPAMKAELDRANRQVEELKRQAKMLQDKLAVAQNPNKQGAMGASKSANGKDEPSDAELKHKLETAQKMHAKLKEDFDKTVKRLDEAKQSETKLRVEIAKLQNELKAAAKGAAKKAS